MVVFGVCLFIAIALSAVATWMVCLDVARMFRDEAWYKTVAAQQDATAYVARKGSK